MIGCQNISRLALFEAFETLRQTLAKKIVRFVEIIWMNKKILICVKGEKSNLNTMMATLKLIVSYETLGVVESFQSTCFGQASLSLVTSKNKMCRGFKYVSINKFT